MNLIDLELCKLLFQDIENKTVEFEHRVFGGLPTNLNGKVLPNILGRDFLDSHSLNIIGRPGKKFLIEYKEESA